MLHLDTGLEKMESYGKGGNECGKHIGKGCFSMTCQVISSGQR